MSVGRLIFPVMAEISPFAVAAEQDDDFKEPRVRYDAVRPPVPASPSEGKPFFLLCQVEPEEFAALNMRANGDAPRTKINLIFHARAIKTGLLSPKRGDRLLALRSRKGELLLDGSQLSLHATECRPISFGLGRNSVANLLRVAFVSRSQGIRSAG